LKEIKIKDVALYIFICTVVGHYINFSYSWGYNNYFSIPLHFIDFSILNITKSTSFIGIGIASIVLLGIFFLDETDIKWIVDKLGLILFKPKINLGLQFLVLIFSIVIIYLLGLESNSKLYVFYLLMFKFFSMIYFILKKYLKAFIVSVLIIFFMLPYTLGIMNAIHQTDFFIINNDIENIVITFTDNKVILAKFDIESNTIYPVFKVLSIDALEKENSELKLFKIYRPNVSSFNNKDSFNEYKETILGLPN